MGSEGAFCFRCLSVGHWAPKCTSSVVCSVCSRKNHTLVHKDGVGNAHQSTSQTTDSGASSLIGHLGSSTVLLGTALVHILDAGGALHTACALVD